MWKKSRVFKHNKLKLVKFLIPLSNLYQELCGTGIEQSYPFSKARVRLGMNEGKVA